MARRKAAPRTIQKRDRFKELRLQLGKTQRALSMDLDITESFLRELESGRANPEITFAFKIARYFGTTVDDVFQDLAN
ncbi:helix-turn-helix domain-containing protein [Paenibacillus sp. N4]|uniref:helix-turn-helix transcriptional regulator n=1 Tax=Paenibacillus vietnamensis TaxID=2590547 RepID=UPI001CD0920A|nr:helix-turn-helix domain-containing protein [Paenibacillus vietnamensis]MCA0754878.1 helix-turn-helix domain-containing protein [Paenibacillus vietnamensis]